MNLHYLLFKPLITEKTMAAQKINTFTFSVDPRATKNQIKTAVEQQFKVHVTGIRTVTISGIVKRTGRKRLPTRTSAFKKAFVTLKSGESIDLFEAKG